MPADRRGAFRYVITTFTILMLGGIVVMAETRTSLDLSRYQWENRLLLIFAPTHDNDAYRQQLEHLSAHDAGLKDRDLIVFHLFHNEPGRVGDDTITPDAVARLRADLEVSAQDFSLLLVGKDGTVKRRSDAPVTTDDLFAQIDGMPMRMREMNEE